MSLYFIKGVSARLLVSAILLLAGLACDDNGTTGSLDPDSPRPPSDPAPFDQARDEPSRVALSWSCSDPNDDVLWYSLALGVTRFPPVVADSLSRPRFEVVDLVPDQLYFWRVTAHDPSGRSTESPLWSFTTKIAFEEGVIFPLAVGNWWRYEQLEYYTNLRGNIRPESYDTTITHVLQEIVGLDTLGNGQPAYVLRRRYVFGEPSHTVIVWTWVNNTADGLYTYAVDYSTDWASAPAPPVLPNGLSALLSAGARAGKGEAAFAKSLQQPTIIDPPWRELAYPLEVGTGWVYIESNGQALYNKVVTDRVSISVPAGTFDCFEVSLDDSSIPIQNRKGWSETKDYIAAQGTILTRLVLRDVAIYYEYIGPEPDGFGDLVELTRLISYRLRD